MMKNLKTILSLSALCATAFTAHAAGHAGAPMASASASSGVKSDLPMADGEIRKIDQDTKKITIKHGEIKNLDMSGMTMVFGVTDATMLDKIKVGDKVKFSAEKVGSAIVVTDIQATK